MTVPEHNDFWIRNVLFPREDDARAKNPYGFVIIDWASARIPGAPFYDLLKFLSSIGASSRVIRRELHFHAEEIRASNNEILLYILTALGGIGTNLGYFPEKRFLALSRQIYDRASRALGVD
jgi:hypothetical protein